jgi:hypothetical protein
MALLSTKSKGLGFQFRHGGWLMCPRFSLHLIEITTKMFGLCLRIGHACFIGRFPKKKLIKECRLLGCYAVGLLYEPTFRKKLSPMLVTLKMEAIFSFETSILTRSTRRNILESSIFHSHRRESLKSYLVINYK